jgi:hypothetical protein
VSVSNPTATPTWPSYIDFEETWQYLQFDEAPTGPKRTMLQRFIDSACAQAQARSNRPFAPMTFYERHDGWSGEYIMLDYCPFLRLVKCTEWQSTGGPNPLPESEPGSGINGIQIDYGTSRVMRTFDGSWPRPFFPGSRNIEITYVAGFNPVPPDVWEATVELVAYKWRNSQEATRWFKPGMQYDATSSLYPGIPDRCGQVFDNYRLPSVR